MIRSTSSESTDSLKDRDSALLDADRQRRGLGDLEIDENVGGNGHRSGESKQHPDSPHGSDQGAIAGALTSAWV